MLTWIIFGMNLLRPVPVEGDSVLCCSTGTAVKQRLICSVTIQGLYVKMRRQKRKEKLKEPDIQKTMRQERHTLMRMVSII